MSRSCWLAALLCIIGPHLYAAGPTTFPEYGVVRSETAKSGALSYTYWQTKDLTGALALWEALREPGDKPCTAAPFCSLTRTGVQAAGVPESGVHTVVFDANYVVAFSGEPKAEPVNAVLASLPNRKETSLPAILTFLPRTGLTPGSARYVLGPASLEAYAPEFVAAKPGFEQGAEAQIASYGAAKLALFYYPTPEMARLHLPAFRALSNTFAKRSGVLVAIAYGNVSQKQADTLLSRVQYEAKITWNETTKPPPIKAMYSLLVNILYLSGIIVMICLLAGIIYGGMRIYRRRYGQLDAEEAMTTLGLGGE